jgi:hypothetical protein
MPEDRSSSIALPQTPGLSTIGLFASCTRGMDNPCSMCISSVGLVGSSDQLHTPMRSAGRTHEGFTFLIILSVLA